MQNRNLTFIGKLIRWYNLNKRSLPWRGASDPYRVWLSEIILQQTRVDQGTPYFVAFTTQFPTIRELAEASEQSVLRLWQGLGYYSRARNLHRCAKIILKEKQGLFPPSKEELMSLPGIGPYTASAIASICFGERVAVVDGNVYRVLARIFGIHTDTLSSKGKNQFQQLANDLMSATVSMPDVHPGDYNQALMEFGALHCRPKDPSCDTCPLASMCVARAESIQHMLPVKKKPLKKKRRFFHYLLATDTKNIILRKRGSGDIWTGLYDFPALEADRKASTAVLTRWFNSLPLPKGKSALRPWLSLRHLLSHQEIHALFYKVDVPALTTDWNNRQTGFLRASLTRAGQLPKPIIIAKVLSLVVQQESRARSKPKRDKSIR